LNIFLDDPLKKPDPSKPSTDECNLVFHAKLGNHDLLYAAEIDGIMTKPECDANPKKRPDLLLKSELVELKTARQFPNGQMPHNFRKHNLRKWWCQSFTVGVSNILVGFRDDEGVVHELQLLPLVEVSKLGATVNS
jgi:RAT1-interacting protein